MNLTLAKEEVQLIVVALSHLPYRQSAPLIARLMKQVQESKEKPAE